MDRVQGLTPGRLRHPGPEAGPELAPDQLAHPLLEPAAPAQLQCATLLEEREMTLEPIGQLGHPGALRSGREQHGRLPAAAAPLTLLELQRRAHRERSALR